MCLVFFERTFFMGCSVYYDIKGLVPSGQRVNFKLDPFFYFLFVLQSNIFWLKCGRRIPLECVPTVEYSSLGLLRISCKFD